MEKNFLKNRNEFIGAIISITISVILVIIGLIFILKNNENWYLLVIGLFFMIISLLWFFCSKQVLSKIIITKEGIKSTRLKKVVSFIKWDEITEVKQTPAGMLSFYLSIISELNRIDIDVCSKKMYEAIITNCTNSNVKHLIENIKYLKFFHKNK